MIYFIQDESTLLIKIGFTDGPPEARLKALQTGCPSGLRLLHAIEGDRETEANWHSDYQQYRDRGEWFRPGPELIRGLMTEMGMYAHTDGYSRGYQAGTDAASEAARSPYKCGHCGEFIGEAWGYTTDAPDSPLCEPCFDIYRPSPRPAAEPVIETGA